METTSRPGWAAVVLAAGMTLTACGGGGGGGDAAPAPEPTAPPQAAALTGTAAIGAALAGGEVTVLDSTGAPACDAGSELTTGATGAYRCVLKATAAAPFVVAVADPAGLVDSMLSVAARRPGAGETSTVNVSRLTTAIVAQVVPNRDAFALTRDAAQLTALDLQALESVKGKVVTQLAPVIREVGLDPAGYDPIATPFTGGSNAGADALLDQVIVRFENGAPVLANVLAPQAPVPMADAATAVPAPVAASAVDGFSMQELNFVETALEACFAVPATARPGHGACSGIVVDDAPAALTGAARFLNNGFSTQVGGLGPLLGDPDMDGARFNPPELLRFVQRADGRHHAVVNLKFADGRGNPDNRIWVLKKFPGTRTADRPSDWWVYGNQRPLNFRVRAAIRQQEQMIPPGDQGAYGAGPSRYQTGLEIYIARPCADTLRQCPNTADLRYVRVKGPGLPPAGLVFADVGSLPQSWMAILNANGTIPTGPHQTVNSSNNIFWLQRSRDVAGADAFRIRPNPFVAQATPTFNFWAHPAMYGEPASSTWSFDLSRVPAWSEYTFEVFRGDQTTTSEIYTASIVTPVVPAAYAATQQWHAITPQTKALAAPGAPAATTLDLAWTVNPYAQRIESVQAYSGGGGKVVNSSSRPVPKGASSQTVTAVGGEFPALSLSTPGLHRFLQMRYKMVDGSYKDMGASFN